MFLSPDGKSARFFITQQGRFDEPREGIAACRTRKRKADQDGLESLLSNAKIYRGGTAATLKDMH